VALAPAVRNVHLAASRVFRRAAEDAPEEIQQAMRDQALHAEEEAAAYAELIASQQVRYRN